VLTRLSSGGAQRIGQPTDIETGERGRTPGTLKHRVWEQHGRQAAALTRDQSEHDRILNLLDGQCFGLLVAPITPAPASLYGARPKARSSAPSSWRPCPGWRIVAASARGRRRCPRS
jgi:hypothetical protein